MSPQRLKRPSRKRSAVSIEINEPLPSCDGPKLGAFQYRSAAIQFIDLLSAESPGGDGHVFEVAIRSKHYALKIFNFFDPPSDPDDLEQFGVSEEIYIGQTDPFYAECRAYGCIEENQQNGLIAVRCYGHMTIPAEREDELADPPFETDEWNRPEKEYDQPKHERQPFRAIVKELVRCRKRLSRVAQMRKDLLALHKIGVYVQDIRQENYINGKLVDFSKSWTAPHALLDSKIRSQNLIDAEIRGDLLDFECMMEEAGIRTSSKAFVEPNKPGRLRAQVRKPDRYGF